MSNQKNDHKKPLIVQKHVIENEENCRILMQHTSDVIWVLNIDLGKFTFISPSIYKLRGYTVEEAMQQDISQSLTPRSAKNVMDSISQNIKEFIANPEKPISYTHELQQPCKDGSIIWIETSTHFQYNSKNEIEVVGISRNIDDRKKAEAKLKDYKERLDQTLLGTNSGTFTYDIPNDVIIADKVTQNLLGLNKSRLSFEEWGINILPDDRIKARAKIAEETKNQAKNIELTYRVIFPDQTVRHIQNISFVKYNNNNPVKVYGIVLDITKRKKIEEELKIANQRLDKKLAKLKRELVSNALQMTRTSEIIKMSLRQIDKLLKKHRDKKFCDDLLIIRKEMEQHQSKNDNWELFRIRFQEVHNDFFDNLKKKHPGLTKTELKFCAYMRINLSSSQIASALNISNEGVRKNRYRIRKKIGLKRNDSLEDYISKI